MKLNSRTRAGACVGAMLLLVCGNTEAQTATNGAPALAAGAPPAPSAGLVNDWLREQSPGFNPFDFGGQFRARFVDQTYFAVQGGGAAAVDFRANTPHSENDFLLLRTRVHAGYSPTDWLGVWGEGQDSSSTGDRRNPNLQSDGPFDFRQGFLRLGDPKREPVTLKVGRQELAYGDERLVGVSDWDNITRVFDAAKLRFEQSGYWVDAFVSRVVLPDDNHFDQPNWSDFFSGVYASTRSLVPKTEVQAYFLADNAGADSLRNVGSAVRGNSPRDIYTIGSRFQTLPGQLNGWDVNGEFAGQFGDFVYATGTPGVIAGKRLDHLAYATHVEGGYSFAELEPKPRLALGLDYASGDDNPQDHEHNTFVNLYPTNHKFYGAMDLFSWQNLIDPYFKASLAAAKGLTFALTYNALWLATTSDFMYQVTQAPRTTGGYGIHPNAGSFAGHELDLILTYQPKTFLQLQAGFGHFFTGSYVNDTLAPVGGARDADWVYLQTLISF